MSEENRGRIYVASSWKNQHQPKVVNLLVNSGFSVYDFKKDGFSWKEVSDNYDSYPPGERNDVKEYFRIIRHPRAEEGYQRDYINLLRCNLCVLVLPCGNSAHLEAGYALGLGRPLVIYIPESTMQWELMYKMTPYVCTDASELLKLCVRHIGEDLP